MIDHLRGWGETLHPSEADSIRYAYAALSVTSIPNPSGFFRKIT
jgi:hypothetical protein